MKMFQRRILCITCLWLCFVFLSGSPVPAQTNVGALKQTLKQAIQTLPQDSHKLQDTLLKTGEQFEAAGIFSEARRCYQYLDFIWEKFPPTDPARHPALKQKIAKLKKRQDNPVAGTLESEVRDSLAIFQKEVIPGNPVECRVILKDPDNVWVTVTPADGAAYPDLKLPLPTLYTAAALNDRIKVKIPKVAGTYTLNFYSSQGRLLSHESVTVLPEPAWAGKLQVETRGIVGFGGTCLMPGESLDLIVHNSPDWAKGLSSERPWIGLFKKDVPDESKKYVTYWYIKKKTEFTRVTAKIKEPGEYELRIFDKDRDDRQILLKTDLLVGTPKPLAIKEGLETNGEALVFDRKQRIKISGDALVPHPENNPDAFCLLLPAWFMPKDIRHGLNHALASVKDINTRGFEMELPDAGGKFQILFYPYWRALKWKTLPEKLADVTVKESAVPRLALGETTFAPGAVVHAGVMAGDIAGRMTVGILAPDHLQIRTNKAGYVMEKKHRLSLEPRQLVNGQGWVDIKAPMVPGNYILALYDHRMLRAALPLTVVPRQTRDAQIIIPKAVLPTGETFYLKAFPPLNGMPKHGYASFQKDGRQVIKKNLYAQYMDDPLSVTAPKEPGTYDVLFYVNGMEDPVARTSVQFVSPDAVPVPGFDTMQPPICPDAMAAFKNEDLLPGARLAEFNMFGDRFEPGQQIGISYRLPPKVPACVVMALRSKVSGQVSVAQAIKTSVMVKELDAKQDTVFLPSQEPGDYTLFFYDTLQWTKAGPPSLIGQTDFTVIDTFHTHIEMSQTACAKGKLVVKLQMAPEFGFSKTFKEVYLYPENINTVFHLPASSAKANFTRVTDTIFHAALPMDLTPGKYQLKIRGLIKTFPITLTAVPEKAAGSARILLSGANIIPRGMAQVQLIPAGTWGSDLAWGLTGTDTQGKTVFLVGPRSIKGNKKNLIQTAVTAPARPGTYQLRFWPGTGKEPVDKLPLETVVQNVSVALDSAYVAAHKPDIKLRAYFAVDDTLYVNMNTQGSFTASIGYDKDGWIGFLPGNFDTSSATAKEAKKAAVWSLSMGGRDTGRFGFMTPEEPGEYILCMYDGMKNGHIVYQKNITLRIPDMAKLEAAANAGADAFLESLPDYEEDTKAAQEAIKQNYMDAIEVPAVTPIPVTPQLYKSLQNADTTSGLFQVPARILSYIGPDDVCAATDKKRTCEDDLDMTLNEMRKVNINFGDGVDMSHVVGELAVKVTTDLAIGNKYVAQAKGYYDKAEAHYNKAMKLKTSVEKNGWQGTAKDMLWNSTKSMLESCATSTACLSRMGRKAIEASLKGYNPKKMTKAQVAQWKKENAAMVILLTPEELKSLEEKTLKYTALAGELAADPNPPAKAYEMAKAAAINTLKTSTMAAVEKLPGWKFVKAYYETLNVLKGALINDQTVTFMNKYRQLRDEGSTIPQINDILGSEGAHHMRTALKERIRANPKAYKKYLTEANWARVKDGKAIDLSDGEADRVVMETMESWYRQEKADRKMDGFYDDMKDAFYKTKCGDKFYEAQFKDDSIFDAVKKTTSHVGGKVYGLASGKQSYSSIYCTRKALAFKSYLDLRSQVMQQMAGWNGKAPACRMGTRENLRMQDELICAALSQPELYKRMMAGNAEACGVLPKPLPAKITSKAKIKTLTDESTRALVKALERSGNEDVNKCLCNRHSIMGSGCFYHPKPTKGKSPACDKGGPACIQGNWGCSRLNPATDAASLKACQAGKALSEWKRKDNPAYKKWLEERKKGAFK